MTIQRIAFARTFDKERDVEFLVKAFDVERRALTDAEIGTLGEYADALWKMETYRFARRFGVELAPQPTKRACVAAFVEALKEKSAARKERKR